jgi:2,6-dihydroxypseudooxynicotine hydrolase
VKEEDSDMNKEEEKNILKTAKEGKTWRFFGLGARPEDLFETYSRIEKLSDWCGAFAKTAQRFETTAEKTQDAMVKTSNFLTAALYHHIGHLFVFDDGEEKMEAYRSIVRAYGKAIPYFWRPTELVEYPFGGITFSAYFRHVQGAKKAPCVVLLRGVDACREVELHCISNFLLEKGFSTLSIDVPGQGEPRFRGLKMTPDFEKPVGAALDYLEKRPEVDANKIAILGQSFGGYIAPRVASLEKRIKACVSLGGFYSLEDFNLPRIATMNVQNAAKIKDSEWQEHRKDFSLEGVIHRLTCPFFVSNGSADEVMPISQSVKLYEKAAGPKVLKVYEGGVHCVYYERKQVLSVIADWLTDALGR